MLLMVPTVASIDTSYLLVGRTVTVTPLQVSIRMNTKRLGRRTGGSGHYNLTHHWDPWPAPRCKQF